MTETSPTELSDRLRDDEDVLVLDIRHRDDYEEWHVPNSINLNVYDELTDDPEAAKDALADLPNDREIVTVCAAGVVSQTATDVLREMGYDATTLTDGMNGWSRVHRSAPVETDLAGTLVQVARPGKGCLSHILISDGEAAVFDASHYLNEYDAILSEYDADLVGVFDTHAHADHVSGGAELAKRNDVPYYLHPKDALAFDATPVEDEATIEVGSVDIDIIHTPGHSEGSVSFNVEDEALLTGDTLFHESVGRVELGIEAGIEESDVEGNAATLYESLQRLLDRPDDAVVLPAHDPGSPEPPVTATLAEVRERNEDLGRDREAFVETLASDIPEHPPNFERVKRANAGQEDVPDEELSELELGPNRCAAE
ncbi:MBL fold metallo-hydrolase [Halopiger xanaduensis]|uniref:Rhodanese-like protein n=1 Tax=Halopiger xanaduensis (strain DSM 18323 / JCM 14033 / SH-6) TaxID=797210 RepID=F8DE99_HALXS|nr:MBL fold metallo-hydrolase [Halopiger xanaduensis]AEH39381.1 Rhodanese-like protein [Halopiger xanaduensis SH-6]